MKVLGEINTKKQLVVDKEFAAQIPATLIKDSTSSIALKSYKPNHLIYSVNAASDKVAVFSEIYYEKGWNAYIDGEKVPYIRANYLLRAMSLKKGQYELEFKFEPVSYSLGNTLALSSSIVLIICLLAFAFFTYRKKKAE